MAIAATVCITAGYYASLCGLLYMSVLIIITIISASVLQIVPFGKKSSPLRVVSKKMKGQESVSEEFVVRNSEHSTPPDSLRIDDETERDIPQRDLPSEIDLSLTTLVPVEAVVTAHYSSRDHQQTQIMADQLETPEPLHQIAFNQRREQRSVSDIVGSILSPERRRMFNDIAKSHSFSVRGKHYLADKKKVKEIYRKF
jgi:hypothetical protein